MKRNELCWCGSGKKYKRCHMQEDQKTKTMPPNGQEKKSNRCKTAAEFEGMRLAGAFNGELLDYVRPYVKAGISTEEINTLVHEYTVSHGHTPAPLGYHGFPKSVCTSVNNIVCHGIPAPDVILRDGDIVNVDCTTIVNGFHGDSSETFFIGDVDPAARHLVDVAAQSLVEGIRAAQPGVTLMVVADAIQSYVESEGCSVVQQYTGHGIGRKFHEHYTVYHHRDPDAAKIRLEPGMTFTIEPMINRGGYRVDTDVDDGWTVRTRDGSLSAQFEHTIGITETGAEIFTLTPAERAADAVLLVEGKIYR